MKKTITKILLLPIIVFSLSGCFLKSVHPLVTSSEAIMLENLDGVYETEDQRWVFASDKNPEMIANLISQYPDESISIEPGEEDSLGLNAYLVLFTNKQSVGARPVLFIGMIGEINGDQFLMTHVTNPLVQSETYDRAIRKFRSNLQNGTFDSLFSVNKMQERFYTEEGTPISHDPRELLPAQCLTPIYKENSNIYIFTRQSFLNAGGRIGQRPFLFEMNETESIDIDNQQDWLISEALLAQRDRWT